MSLASVQLRKLGESNKAIVAVIGGVLISVQAAADIVPGTWAVSVLAALTAASVWLVRNQETIDRAGDAGADLLEH